jgi:hypothetical protein
MKIFVFTAVPDYPESGIRLALSGKIRYLAKLLSGTPLVIDESLL